MLMDAVASGASLGFLSPLSPQTASAYWDTVFVASPLERILLVAEEEGVVVGSVQLALCLRQNALHRAEIQKLCVLRRCRGRGLAAQLMLAVEQQAMALGRTLLVLDTHEGSQASSLYERWGWTGGGVIPDYAANPDGTLHATAFYYKRLPALSRQ